MSNTAKYVLLLVLTFAAGAFTAIIEGHATVVETVKHGAIFSLPTIIALRMKLEEAIGIKDQDSKTKGAGV